MLDDFDSLIQALFADQSVTTLETHTKHRLGKLTKATSTKFETLSEIWERLLPHRKLFITGDDIQVSTVGASERYPASDMSDGERAIFYLIAQALVAAESSLLVIDEPELHVHPSIMASLWDEIEAARSQDGQMIGVPTGFQEMDSLTNGLHKGQLVLIAARPALGKSTLALDLARSAAIKHKLPTIVFSLEMGKGEIAMRLLSAETSIPLQKMRKGQIEAKDWTTIASTRGRIESAPLYIDDSPNMTLVEIRAKCRRLKQRIGLQLIVIDYLQLMTSGKRVESRQQEVSEFSRALKLLAKELQVPVVALSQLNRGPEQRADRKPQLSDLRESGSLEQDADLVILLHRESAYERDNPRAGEADLIVAKHRNGPTGTVVVGFQGHYSRFADMPKL
jgi:replicative DNA helicase